MTALRTVPPRSTTQADAVVLHGMFSGAGDMKPLAKSLEAQECFRKVVRIDLPWTHRRVPQVGSQDHAAWLCERELLPRLARGTLREPLYLIGHSNGGYVALHAAATLGKSVRGVFTLATPAGLPMDYELSDRQRAQVFHLRGGCDSVPFGGRHDPAGGEWVVTFPDEGHSSLHRSASKNGVAVIIGHLSGGPARVFVDSDGVVHPWSFCSTDTVRDRKHLLGERGDFVVCNGMHDPELESLKQKRAPGPVPLAHRIAAYFALRSRLHDIRDAVQQDIRRATAHGAELRGGLRLLREDNRRIELRLKSFDRQMDDYVQRVHEELGVDLRRMKNALDAAEAIAVAPGFSEQHVAEVNKLLESALEANHSILAQTASRGRFSLLRKGS